MTSRPTAESVSPDASPPLPPLLLITASSVRAASLPVVPAMLIGSLSLSTLERLKYHRNSCLSNAALQEN